MESKWAGGPSQALRRTHCAFPVSTQTRCRNHPLCCCFSPQGSVTGCSLSHLDPEHAICLFMPGYRTWPGARPSWANLSFCFPQGGRMLRYLLSARLKPTWVENGRWRAKQKVFFPLQWEGSPLSQCQRHRMPLLTRLLSADGIYRPRCPAREHLNIGERNSDWGLCAHPLTGQVTLGKSSQLPKPLLCQL